MDCDGDYYHIFNVFIIFYIPVTWISPCDGNTSVWPQMIMARFIFLFFMTVDPSNPRHRLVFFPVRVRPVVREGSIFVCQWIDQRYTLVTKVLLAGV